VTDKLKELLTVANVIKLVVGVAAVLSTYFIAEMSQNDKLTETTSALNSHLEDSKRTFENFDKTMTEQRAHNAAERKEQRTFNTETVKSMERMSTIQQQLKKENGRLAKHAEESTSAIVRMTVVQQQLVESVKELKQNR